MSSTAFIFGEDRLARALGLPQKILQKIRARKLTQGQDWDLAHGYVAYNRAGGILLLETASPMIAPEDRSATLEKSRLLQDDPNHTERATIVKLWPNPHLVDCQLADQTLIRIMVKTNEKLRLGMSLRVARFHPQEDPSGFWYELAQKLPRSVLEGRKEHARGA